MSFRNRHASLLLTTALLTLPAPGANALPTGGTVSAGSATIITSPSLTRVLQSTPTAVINWTGFNTAKGEEVSFSDQQGSSSITLNRVSGPATSFNGALVSNGNVWVINPNGVLIGATGTINTSGFLATTSNITDANFMAGNYNFTPGGGAANATVSNAGTITIAETGLAALVAPTVANSGTIKMTGNIINAKVGTIALASGDTFTVDLAGDGLINIAASKAVTIQKLSNTGTLDAIGVTGGGTVAITAAQATSLLDNAINLGGIIEANNLTVSNQSGDLEYSAKFSGSTGGNFSLSAYRNVTIDPDVQVAPSSGKLNIVIDANDKSTGAGAIYVGDTASLNSNGGNITLGGGTNPATGYAVGDSASPITFPGNVPTTTDYTNGIYVDGATLNAAGGNIILSGQGISASGTIISEVKGTAASASSSINRSVGVNLGSEVNANSSVTTTGAGTIAINGIGGTSSEYSTGVETAYLGSTISSGAGAITINGTGANTSVSWGTALDGFVESTSGSIVIKGNGGSLAGSSSYGIDAANGAIFTKSGAITLTGVAGSGQYDTGVEIQNGYLYSATGKITINGSGTSTVAGTTTGVEVDGATISSTGTGTGASTVTINGSGSADGVVLNYANFNAVDGNFYINGTGGSAYDHIIVNSPDFTSTGKGTFNFSPAAILTE